MGRANTKVTSYSRKRYHFLFPCTNNGGALPGVDEIDNVGVPFTSALPFYNMPGNLCDECVVLSGLYKSLQKTSGQRTSSPPFVFLDWIMLASPNKLRLRIPPLRAPGSFWRTFCFWLAMLPSLPTKPPQVVTGRVSPAALASAQQIKRGEAPRNKMAAPICKEISRGVDRPMKILAAHNNERKECRYSKAFISLR